MESLPGTEVCSNQGMANMHAISFQKVCGQVTVTSQCEGGEGHLQNGRKTVVGRGKLCQGVFSHNISSANGSSHPTSASFLICNSKTPHQQMDFSVLANI